MRDYSMIDRLEATLKRYNEIGEKSYLVLRLYLILRK